MFKVKISGNRGEGAHISNKWMIDGILKGNPKSRIFIIDYDGEMTELFKNEECCICHLFYQDRDVIKNHISDYMFRNFNKKKIIIFNGSYYANLPEKWLNDIFDYIEKQKSDYYEPVYVFMTPDVI